MLGKRSERGCSYSDLRVTVYNHLVIACRGLQAPNGERERVRCHLT